MRRSLGFRVATLWAPLFAGSACAEKESRPPPQPPTAQAPADPLALAWRNARVGDRVVYSHRSLPDTRRENGVGTSTFSLEVVRVDPPRVWIAASVQGEKTFDALIPVDTTTLTKPWCRTDSSSTAETLNLAGQRWATRRVGFDRGAVDGPHGAYWFATPPGPTYLLGGMVRSMSIGSGFSGVYSEAETKLEEVREGNGGTPLLALARAAAVESGSTYRESTPWGPSVVRYFVEPEGMLKDTRVCGVRPLNATELSRNDIFFDDGRWYLGCGVAVTGPSPSDEYRNWHEELLEASEGRGWIIGASLVRWSIPPRRPDDPADVLDPTAVEKVVRANESALLKCARDHREGLMISFDVEGNGTAHRVRMRSSGVAPETGLQLVMAGPDFDLSPLPELSACLEAALNGFHFPRHTGAASTVQFMAKL